MTAAAWIFVAALAACLAVAVTASVLFYIASKRYWKCLDENERLTGRVEVQEYLVKDLTSRLKAARTPASKHGYTIQEEESLV